MGPVPPGRDAEEYDRIRRRVLWMLPTGLYVLGSRAGPERNLMTTSWVVQVALEPKLLAVSVEGDAVTHGLVDRGRVFALSILPRSERTLVRRFAKPVEDQEVDEKSGRGTMGGSEVRAAITGAPILEVAAAWIDCEVRHSLSLGSHTLFIGEVVDCGTGPGREPSELGKAEVLRMEDTRMSYGG